MILCYIYIFIYFFYVIYIILYYIFPRHLERARTRYEVDGRQGKVTPPRGELFCLLFEWTMVKKLFGGSLFLLFGRKCNASIRSRGEYVVQCVKSFCSHSWGYVFWVDDGQKQFSVRFCLFWLFGRNCNASIRYRRYRGKYIFPSVNSFFSHAACRKIRGAAVICIPQT